MNFQPRTIGFLGDLHVGSYQGLYPIEQLPADKKTHLGPRYLMQCWYHLIDHWPQLDILFLMGDLIDGKQPKSRGVGIFTGDLGEQTDRCIEVLEPAIRQLRPKKIMRVWGTPYHEEFDNNLAALDKHFGVEVTRQVIDYSLGEHNLNVAHHPASGAAIYQGTVADREVLWSKVATIDKKTPPCRWIVRAHKHNYYHWSDDFRTMVGMPCWQLPTGHAVKTNYWRFQPSIGGVLMVADKADDSGYRFLRTKYDLPPFQVLRWKDARKAKTA